MVNKNFQNRNDNNEGKSKAGIFWKHVGLIALALGLAVLTVFVLNLNIRA
jgi:hypothetical protein